VPDVEYTPHENTFLFTLTHKELNVFLIFKFTLKSIRSILSKFQVEYFETVPESLCSLLLTLLLLLSLIKSQSMFLYLDSLLGSLIFLPMTCFQIIITKPRPFKLFSCYKFEYFVHLLLQI